MISRTYDRNILDIYIYILLNNLYTRRTRMTHPEQGGTHLQMFTEEYQNCPYGAGHAHVGIIYYYIYK